MSKKHMQTQWQWPVLLRYLPSPDSLGSRIYFGFSDLGLPAIASAAPGIQPERSAAEPPAGAAGGRD